jgi:hypothetical protein
MMVALNLTKGHCKHIWKCHSEPPVQQTYAMKIKIITRAKMAQVVESLPSKCYALSSNPSTPPPKSIIKTKIILQHYQYVHWLETSQSQCHIHCSK